MCSTQHEHECNEDATVFESAEGKRFYFKTADEAKSWYEKTSEHIIMGSVACSVCGIAMIDQHMKL